MGMEKLFLIFCHVFSPQSLEPNSTADHSGGPHLRAGQANLPVTYTPTATNYTPGD